MGFYYRKSISAGPFRVNLGRSGIGYSIGGKGFRTGVSSRGRTYTNMSIPGTGIGYRASRSGCMFALTVPIGLAVLAVLAKEVLT